MIFIGLAAGTYAAFAVRHPDVQIDSFDVEYMVGVQTREQALKRAKIGSWLVSIASPIWTGYWLYRVFFQS